ncbi:hypothetical protein Aperf_G00000109685 [Anoplocephala perfoliata]
MPPPTSNAHVPLMPGCCPVRIAFITSDQKRGFLNYELGDELHCGVVDSSGCVHSYSPREKRFRKERSNLWKQSIVCEVSEVKGIDASRWDQIIQEVVGAKPNEEGFDCLDFAIEVLNEAMGDDSFSREKKLELLSSYCKTALFRVYETDLKIGTAGTTMVPLRI